LQLGAAYTWSKSLGVSVGHPTNTRTAGYGPTPQDRTNSLTFNYIYDFPDVARRGFLDHPIAKIALNGWQFSGLTAFASGAPVNVTYNVSGIGATTLNREITGSEDIAPRVVFTCNPNESRGTRNLNAFINTSCFAPAPKGSIGLDSGYDRLRGPGLENFDMSLFKNVSIKEKVRVQLRLEAFNALNHTEWGAFANTITFNAAGSIINLPTQLGGTGGRLGFGTENVIRTGSQRILQIGAKLYF
jgi:hypothetical protein